MDRHIQRGLGRSSRRLRPFLFWCLGGAYGALTIAACASILLGVIETYVAALLGYVIDVVIETPPHLLFVEQWPFLLTAIGFFNFFTTHVLFSIVLLSINGSQSGCQNYGGN